MDSVKSFTDLAPYLTQPLILAGFVLLLVFGIHKALIKSGILPPVGPRTGGIIVQTILKYGFWLAVLVIVLGFGLKAYDIRQNRLSTQDIETLFDVDTVTVRLKKEIQTRFEHEVRVARAAGKKWDAIRELERRRDTTQGRIDEIVRTIKEGLGKNPVPFFIEATLVLEAEGRASLLRPVNRP